LYNNPELAGKNGSTIPKTRGSAHLSLSPHQRQAVNPMNERRDG